MTRTSPQEDLYSGTSCTWLQSFCDSLNLSNNCYSRILGIRDSLGRKVRDVQGRGCGAGTERGRTAVARCDIDLGVLKTQQKHDREARGDQEQAGLLKTTGRGDLLAFLQHVGWGREPFY